MQSTTDDALSGDLNADGILDSVDVDLLCSAVHDGPSKLSQSGDFDGNGELGAGDVDAWLSQFADTVKSDLNLDGEVGFADFLILSADFGSQMALRSEGDINCDGEVGFADFLALSSQFGFQRDAS